MFESLFRFDFPSAFFYNPLMFILLFLWNTIAILCFWGKPTWIRQKKFLYPMFYISIAAFLVFGISRICTLLK